MTSNPVLEIDQLRVEIAAGGDPIVPVDGVSLTVGRGETVGLVGESGCGKSVTAMSIMRLLPPETIRIAGGRVSFDGRDLASLSERELRRVRGKEISMIFQEPMTALNPVFTIGSQMIEPLRRHLDMSRKAARERAAEMLGLVGIPDPVKVLSEYPYQLSGGMRQRVMIAMAMACEPRLLIADEPTTALDVTTQSQILELIVNLQQQMDTAVLLITHDLGVVARSCQRVAVMYCGRVVEQAAVGELFARPNHPYTVGLLGSLPTMNRGNIRLTSIAGTVPPLDDLPSGCRFAPRCAHRVDACVEAVPEARAVTPGHDVSCLRPVGVTSS